MEGFSSNEKYYILSRSLQKNSFATAEVFVKIEIIILRRKIMKLKRHFTRCVQTMMFGNENIRFNLRLFL